MPKPPTDASKLRHAAESRLSENLATSQTNSDALAQAHLLHELQVHRIEMEMQSEELQRAHRATVESLDRYLDLYEFSPVGYITLTQEGRITEINLTGALLFGIERSGATERKFVDLIAPQEADRWRDFFQTMLNQGGHQNAEFRLARSGTEAVHVRLDCIRVCREQNKVVVHVAMTDISAQKQAENRLREQEELFRMIAERLDGFIAVLDVEGRRIYNSPSYQRLIGNRDISGTNSFNEIHPDDREQIIQAFRETVASGIGKLLEYRFVMPDGETRIMESRGGVARDSDGRTKYVVVVSNDVTDRKAAEQKIHHLAFYDALTQLPNRLALNDRLQQAMAASKRSGRYGAVMFLDLDNFKPLNDAYGHLMGDRLLVQTARRISDCVREIDTVARFGGDEFVIVLGELDVDLANSVSDAELIAEKIRLAIAAPYALESATNDPSLPCVTHSCTASIGVVLFMNQNQSEEEVLKLADIAMYRAKEEGRDKIYFYGADHRASADDK